MGLRALLLQTLDPFNLNFQIVIVSSDLGAIRWHVTVLESEGVLMIIVCVN